MGHIVDCIVTLAALVAILDYFGIKPNRPRWGIPMPLTKNWRLALMLLLIAASLGMTGYSVYRSTRPKIIEKPVDRIVEKKVPAECPKAQPAAASAPNASPKPEPKGAAVSNQAKQVGNGNTANPGSITAPITQGPCGVVQNGGSNNTASTNCTVPDRRLSPSQTKNIEDAFTKICPLPKTIAVNAANSNQEAQMYAMDFVKAFRSAGCKADLLLPVPGLEPDAMGIHLGVHDTTTISPEAVTFGNAIGNAGFHYQINPTGPDFFTDEQFVWIIGAREDPPKPQ